MTPVTDPADPRAAGVGPPDAVTQDGRYPRPRLVRRGWADLCGLWDFGYGVDDDRATPVGVDFDKRIVVPFPPESPVSGIGQTGFAPVVWYRRRITTDDLVAAGHDAARPRLLLHFGAVDWRADVWLDGRYLGHHEGGQTPFSFDITERVEAATGPLDLVVRAVDDPGDVDQPRGKQDWRERPHGIWYHRSTGIWQPVWLEAVPPTYATDVLLVPDVPGGALDVTVELNRRPVGAGRLAVRLDHEGVPLGHVEVSGSERVLPVRVPIARLRNGADEDLLWAPWNPTLIGVTVEVADEAGVDTVASYTGLRSVATERRVFLINDRPIFVRSVLAQGYWPESHLAAPSPTALRREVELIKELGFNAVRVHQKVEDPRFLYWADRLGLLVWAETANAYAFGARSVELLTAEWMDIVRRDRSHPCVVTWVPINESWGVPRGPGVAAQRHYARALASLTRALDPTRPVVSNDGWEHVDSDIWTTHDYTQDGDRFRDRYDDPDRMPELLDRFGPNGHRMRLDDAPDRGQPFMVTEFGGIGYDTGAEPGAWGYVTATSAEEFQRRLTDLVPAAARARGLAGFCYTQLTDTGQETNGLLRADRTPKLPVEVIRALVRTDRG
ncbi:glycoside hydrolase family 2 protein [Plantactinospora sp. GCM10030261]|uniref:glycoside hydrolase family 2 protein n=1 Tax=Plantactinospora sp. GCM10030261 TaxID=3273420 RepID=UPI00361654F6